MSITNMTKCLGVLLLVAAGCASSGTKYHDRNMDFGSLRNVAVLPFANLSRDAAAGDRVRDVFSSMLLATEAIYVLPAGEVARGLGRIGVSNAAAPSVEEVVKLGQLLKVEAVFTGVVKEYGEVRSGSASGNVVSLSIQLQETATGKVVWAGSTTKGGVGFGDRLIGSGGTPVNYVTEDAVNDLLNKLFR
jgi:hypothetical protein